MTSQPMSHTDSCFLKRLFFSLGRTLLETEDTSPTNRSREIFDGFAIVILESRK